LSSNSRITFIAALLLLNGWAAWEARSFAELAQFFPNYIVLFAIPLLLFELVREIKSRRSNPQGNGSTVEFRERIPATLASLGWFFGYFLIIYLVGFFVATGVFIFMFLVVEAKISWWQSLFAAGITVVITKLLGDVLSLDWPQSLMGSLF